ncbi:MFS transporter [Planobispora rosea]|uniref:MFS transporter n=1 Tax=Planobispora rosea TaxID=35762 RepID=UPI00083A83F4|nr:MFS transporter [Planobispora rosea]
MLDDSGATQADAKEPVLGDAAPKGGRQRRERYREGTEEGSPRLVLLTMASAGFLLSMIQSTVVPALPLMASQLNTSLTTVAWATTVVLLSASAMTPLMGRLGDVHGHKVAFIGVLTVALAGSLLGALTHSVGLLILARALQGVSLGLFPLAMSVLHREMPSHRLAGSMAITASAMSVGGCLALVAGGLLTLNGADYRRIFWLSVVLCCLVLLLATRLPRRRGPGGRVDYAGAALLALGLLALLLPISQGERWGWASAPVLGLFGIAAFALCAFVWSQARSSQPLVAVGMLKNGPVLAANIAGFCVGLAMLVLYMGATYFVQAPTGSGYGFAADGLRTAFVYMLPGAIAAILAGPILGSLVQRFGPKIILVLGSLVGLGAMLMFTLRHATTAEVVIAIMVGDLAIAAAYASMPVLLVAHVRPEETGVANSINSITRTIGGAVGAAVVGALLVSDVKTVVTGTGPIELPTEDVYNKIFLLGAVFFAGAAVAAALVKTPRLRDGR